MKLFLKGERCFGPKCPIDKEASPPRHARPTSAANGFEHGLRLREKQKLKRFYGLFEGAIPPLIYAWATHAPLENTGEQLLSILER